LCKEIYWLKWPLVQWLLRWLAQCHWFPSAELLEFTQTLFTRLGDTKCVEETHRLGRAQEKRGQQPDRLCLHTFYSMMQGDKTPLADRGLRYLQVPRNCTYEARVKPSNPWPVIFGKKALKGVPAATLGGLSGKSDKFVGRTPASGRRSICAAIALVELHKLRQLEDATSVWQALALLPHTLIRNETEVLFTIACGRFAARVWVVEALPRDQEASLSTPRRWGFRAFSQWRWIVIVDISEWHVILHKWVTNVHDTGQFGFIVAEELIDGVTHGTPASGEGVIAVAEQLDGVLHGTLAEQIDRVTHGTPVSGEGVVVGADQLDGMTHCTPTSGLEYIVAKENIDGVTHGTPASGTVPSPENLHLHIPAVVVALVAPGRHRLNIADRTSLHALFGVSLNKKPANMAACKEVEVALFEKVMSGHPLLPRYLQLLEDWHKAEAARNRKRKQKDPTKAGLCVSIVGVCFRLVPQAWLSTHLLGVSTNWLAPGGSQSGSTVAVPTPQHSHTHTRQVMTKRYLPAVVLKRRMGRHVH
jgi:hypothetical protein